MKASLILMVTALLLAGTACSSCGGGGEEDADTDMVADTPGDEGVVDVHPDPDADPAPDPDAGADVDAEGEAQGDPAADGDAEAEVPGDAVEDAPGDGDLDTEDGYDPSTNPCAQAGGICTGSTMCETTVVPSGAPGCIFDDGPGVCCLPPDPEPTGDTCDSYGGVCATVGACYRVGGWFTPADCHMGGSVVCCVPGSVCGEHDIWICCDPGPEADFVPTCDRTGLTCPFEGTTMVHVHDCT